MNTEQIGQVNYSKLSATELSDLVVGKQRDRLADQEAFRRLCGKDDPDGKMLGELLINLVPNILKMICKQFYSELKARNLDGSVVSEVYRRMQLGSSSWKSYQGRCRLKNWLGGHGGIVYEAAWSFIREQKWFDVHYPTGGGDKIEKMVGTNIGGHVSVGQKPTYDSEVPFEKPLPYSRMNEGLDSGNGKQVPMDETGSAESSSRTSDNFVFIDVEFPCGSTVDNPAIAAEKGERVTIAECVFKNVVRELRTLGKISQRDWEVYCASEYEHEKHTLIAEKYGTNANNVAQIKSTVFKKMVAEGKALARKMGLLK